MLLRTATALMIGLAAPVAALDLATMNADERSIFRAEVRAYLLENPEVLTEAIAILQQREQQQQVNADLALVQANAQSLADDGHSFIGGNPDGDITIIEFMDYRCGYCKRAFPEVAELVAGDGNIRYIVKEFPILGEQSVLASQFAIATQLTAGDAAYKQVHDTLMEFQGDVTEPMLTRLSDAFGLDSDAILAKMNSDEVNDIIAQNRALAQRLQITGTPTFVVDDQMLRGYLPLADMQTLVAQQRVE